MSIRQARLYGLVIGFCLGGAFVFALVTMAEHFGK